MIPDDGLRRASGSAVALGYSLLERTERGADRVGHCRPRRPISASRWPKTTGKHDRVNPIDLVGSKP